jgi:hypothetical protein
MKKPEARYCLYCGEELKGRLDKKFCDDSCRSSYNNQINSDANALVKNINNALRRNRRIMESLIPEEGKLRISGRKLKEMGYDFLYHTHTITTRAGATYVFCYEYGYLPLDNDFFMLVKRLEN